jgi:hypothetical protein
VVGGLRPVRAVAGVSAPARPVPFDQDAEEAIIGGALVWPERCDGIVDRLSASDFYRPAHAAIWTALGDLLAEGNPVDAVTVAARVRLYGGEVEEAEILRLMANGLPPTRQHVEIVLRHAAARRLLGLLTETRAAVDGGEDPYSLAARLGSDLDDVASGASGGEPEALTVPDLIASAETSAPWIVPGLLRSDWRAVVVAAEGCGKSTLLRQLAICAAQGVHPLRHERMAPVRTLIVDGENPRAAIAETGATLDAQVRRTAGTDYDAERCRVWSRPGGLDLRDPRDRADFTRELRAHHPQLVVAGPVYKLARRRERESYEDAAEGVLAVLDDLRVRFGFALLLEHHAPKGQGGSRELAPFGSQRWLAWPELGLSLRAEGNGTDLAVGRFRGDRLLCDWPNRLEPRRVWPFVGVWTPGHHR